MTEHADTHAAWIKLLWAWAFVGLSQMTPLQWVQFMAAIAATIYSAVQTFLLVRDRMILKRREKRKG